MKSLTIGRLAREAGVNLATIRYYERRGLLLPPQRTAAGYRIYSEESVRRLGFIRHAQGLGFTLAEVSDLLALATPKRRSSEICDVATGKIVAIDQKIHQLKTFRSKLQRLTHACSRKGSGVDCEIVKELYR